MEPHIAKVLLALNHKFYQTFAADFSATRQRIQPGVARILETLPPDANLLDLGCGNGSLAQTLAESGHRGLYTGLDASEGLVQIARDLKLLRAEFFVGDLTTPDWHAGLPHVPYDYILCFAVMHHLPGEEIRLRFLEKVRGMLAPQGFFIHSNWQFLQSPKLRARIQPWARAGLSEEEVDAGDCLLDWRRGGQGLRYVHHYSRAELKALAEKSGFHLTDQFTSDGQTGDLGLYQVWELLE